MVSRVASLKVRRAPRPCPTRGVGQKRDRGRREARYAAVNNTGGFVECGTLFIESPTCRRLDKVCPILDSQPICDGIQGRRIVRTDVFPGTWMACSPRASGRPARSERKTGSRLLRPRRQSCRGRPTVFAWRARCDERAAAWRGVGPRWLLVGGSGGGD